jgi:GntR family transcriptional regulator, galactonate operon transcriptional repressor
MKSPAKKRREPPDPGGQSRTGSTVEEIGRRIVLGQFEPGRVLPTTERLATEFAVSRLAIRETMKTLAGKGLIQARPRRGTVVRPRSDWNRLDPDVLRWHITDRPNAAFVRSVFEVRRIIEPQAAALTAERASQDVVGAIEAAFQKMEISDPTSPESIDADVAFHSVILAGTGNDFIAAFTPVIAAALNVTFRIQRDVGYGREHFVPSHKLILDAIKRGDPEGTREVYMKLLTTAEQDAINGIRQRGM